jgi:myo-inositol-1(or 4)-monophosphatase
MSEFLDVAVRASKEAGALLARHFGTKLIIEKKGEINLVTDIDKASEKLIKSIISERYPDHGFKAEEGTEANHSSPFLWLVDPLDGTTNYAHGFPAFCVSIALIKNGEIIVGCIYNPNLEECFVADKGQGAFLNGQKINPSQTSDLSDAFLVTGFPYDIRHTPETNLKEFAAFALKSQAIRRVGSAALDLAYTAAGRFDGYWEFKLSPWDIAAGILIAEEAGCQVTSWNGGKYDLNKGEILASNFLVHEQMMAVLSSVRSHT